MALDNPACFVPKLIPHSWWCGGPVWFTFSVRSGAGTWFPWGQSGRQKQNCFLHMGIRRTRQSCSFPFWNKPSCIQVRPGFGDRWNGAQVKGLGEEDEGYNFIKNPKRAVTGQSSLIPGGRGAVRTKLPGPVCFTFSGFVLPSPVPIHQPGLLQPGASRKGGLAQTLPSRPHSRYRFDLCHWFCSYSYFLSSCSRWDSLVLHPLSQRSHSAFPFLMHPHGLCFNLLDNISVQLPK